MRLNKLMRNFFLYSLLWGGWVGLLLLVSCTKEAPDHFPDSAGAIRFELALPNTRVVTGMDFVSTWEDGDEVGLFAVKSISGSLQPLLAADNYLHNMKLTYESGDWIADTQVYYPNDGETLSFYAYYPYDAFMDNPTSYIFTVENDQESNGYNKSDFLLAKTGPIEKRDDPVRLNFEHQLALIQVEVSREVNMPHFDSDFEVSFSNIKKEVRINLNSTIEDGVGSGETIFMHKAGDRYLYRAIVPGQKQQNTKFLFSQTTPGREIDMEYNPGDALWRAGNAYRYKLTLGYGIDPDHTYAVGDPYPHVGPVIGIVYEVRNGGKNGKVVSLDEFQGVWSDHFSDVDAGDPENGLKNMRAVADYIQTNSEGRNWANFPVFSWVHAKNAGNEEYTGENVTGVWYLPAIEEALILNEVYQSNVSVFNNWLTAAGGTAITNGAPYWASTSLSINYAYLWTMSNGTTTSSANKTYTGNRARCVLAF
ncbi:MAG: fimbrillin family protein [Tannerellaceae bacterium]|nr:fimbrillin family protein [Tannerellaceae bacterium]